MVNFIDPFGRETIIEVVVNNQHKRVGFVIRKERQSLYESWDLKTTKEIIEALKQVVERLECVQHAIIPALLADIASRHIAVAPEHASSYEKMLEITKEAIFATVQDLHVDKRARIYRRLARVVNKVIQYLVKEKFDTRKMFLATSEWARS